MQLRVAVVLLFIAPCFVAAQDNSLLLADLKGAGGTAVAFSPDGKRLLTAGGRVARVWDVKAGRAVCEFAHEADVEQAVWAANGTRIITGAGGEACVWDAQTGKRLVRVSQPNDLTPVCVSADGKWLVTAKGRSGAALWNAATGEHVRDFDAPGRLSLCRFSPNGNELLTFNEPDGANNLRGWDTPGRFHLRTLSDGREITPAMSSSDYLALADFSPDGNRFVVGTHGAFEVYDIPRRKLVCRTGAFGGSAGQYDCTTVLRFTPDGKHVIWALPFDLRLFSSATADKPAGDTVQLASGCSDVSWSPDGKLLAVTGDERQAGLWDVTWPERVQKGGSLTVKCIAFSPDGKLYATGSDVDLPDPPGQTRVWKVEPNQ